MEVVKDEFNAAIKSILSPQEIQEKLTDHLHIYSFEVLPQSLKQKHQWILWKPEYQPDKDKVNKIPVNPNNYYNASSSNPFTWTSYNKAINALKPGYGLGFVLVTDDGLVGIDIDNCVSNNTIASWARAIIKELNSYTELSPSGTGIRIFVEGDWPSGGNRKGQLEVYTQGRFLTVTGNHIEDTPLTVKHRQEALDVLHREYFTQKVSEIREKTVNKPVSLNDAKLIRIASKSKQGQEFNRLLAGDWKGTYESQSQADQAFCNMLAFWTGKNVVQMDSIFRSSGLYRDKWERQDYREWTINKSIADTKNVFESRIIIPPRTCMGDNFAKAVYFDEQGTFIPAWLAKDILEKYYVKYAVGDFWVYEVGVYRPGGGHKLEKIIQDKLGKATRTSRVNETLDFIRRETYSELPKPQCEYINLKNGRLNWRTSELMPHDPNIFEIVQLPVRYNPEAKSLVCDHYLETSLDYDVIQLAEEIMGYCLIPDTRFEKAIMCVGAGRNGKSIFLFMIQQLLGFVNVANIALQELEENRFRLAELFGKLANIFADLDSRALKGSSFFKMLVSGDPITAERKFKDPFNFVNYARLIFSANKLPRSTDTTFAFYERWLIIPFEKTFDTKNPETDPDLRLKMAKPEELSGILNRALVGLKRLYSTGRFTEPQSIKNALNAYRRQNDSVMAFCEDCVDPAKGKVLIKQDFYSAYKLWCDYQGLKPVSQKKLKSSLIQVYSFVREGRNGNYGPRVWFDIELNEEAPKIHSLNSSDYNFLD